MSENAIIIAGSIVGGIAVLALSYYGYNKNKQANIIKVDAEERRNLVNFANDEENKYHEELARKKEKEPVKNDQIQLEPEELQFDMDAGSRGRGRGRGKGTGGKSKSKSRSKSRSKKSRSSRQSKK